MNHEQTPHSETNNVSRTLVAATIGLSILAGVGVASHEAYVRSVQEAEQDEFSQNMHNRIKIEVSDYMEVGGPLRTQAQLDALRESLAGNDMVDPGTIAVRGPLQHSRMIAQGDEMVVDTSSPLVERDPDHPLESQRLTFVGEINYTGSFSVRESEGTDSNGQPIWGQWQRKDGNILAINPFLESGHTGLVLNGENGTQVELGAEDLSAALYGVDGQETNNISVNNALITVPGIAMNDEQLFDTAEAQTDAVFGALSPGLFRVDAADEAGHPLIGIMGDQRVYLLGPSEVAVHTQNNS